MNDIEILVAFEQKDENLSEKENIISLLNINKKIKVTNDSIKYKDKSFKFNLEKLKSPKPELRIYTFLFSCSDEHNKMLLEIISIVKKIIGKYAQENIITLQDDISKNWSFELYQKIFELENLMRKLLLQFMITKLGIDWYKNAIPATVTVAKHKNNKSFDTKLIYDMDFIQLSSILLTDYPTKDITDLPELKKKLKKKEITENEYIEKIEDFVPKCNWTRYFSSIMDCDSKEFEKKWKNLYDIRCKVAHNNFMTNDMYMSGNKLCEDLQNILTKALSKISEINISPKEIEIISTNTIKAVEQNINSSKLIKGAMIGGGLALLIGAFLG
ncbi:MAG: HEPN domain-containing protein [Spirochaetales bacterium]|nr:HEPN domain-containing protein [Spirochaetales bacterium]